jgi:hypothetical protein
VKFGRTVIGGIIKLFKAVESKDNTGWVIHVVNGIKKHHNVTSQTQYQQTQKH